jgi:dephospho-CoA kinase
MRPILIGITGGIASGKSTFSRMIQQEGHTVIFSDQIGHEVLMLPEISIKLVNAFGNDILCQKKIDRNKLRQIVFNDKNHIEKLNQIVHPEILKAMDDVVNHSSFEYLFFEVPLLFETRLEDCFDFIVLVYVDQTIQIDRLINRNHYSYDHAKSIIDSQMPLAIKIEKSDLSIENNGTEEDLHCQVWKVIKHLSGIRRRKIKSFVESQDNASYHSSKKDFTKKHR